MSTIRWAILVPIVALFVASLVPLWPGLDNIIHALEIRPLALSLLIGVGVMFWMISSITVVYVMIAMACD